MKVKLEIHPQTLYLLLFFDCWRKPRGHGLLALRRCRPFAPGHNYVLQTEYLFNRVKLALH